MFGVGTNQRGERRRKTRDEPKFDHAPLPHPQAHTPTLHRPTFAPVCDDPHICGQNSIGIEVGGADPCLEGAVPGGGAGVRGGVDVGGEGRECDGGSERGEREEHEGSDAGERR
jgi:hypothetical protein